MFVRPQPLGRVFHCGSRPHPSSTKDLKMFTVTEAAGAHLANMLAEAETPEDKNSLYECPGAKMAWA